MKHIKKFLENFDYGDKELMLDAFEKVFNFPLYHLTDRLVEWEDSGFNFILQPVVWIKSEAGNKYDNPVITDFPDKSSNIKTYHFGLCRYRTEAQPDDNIEVVEFPNNFDPNDVVAACIVLYEVFPNDMYLNGPDYSNKEKYFRSEFQNVIKWVEKQFNLVEIEDSQKKLDGGVACGCILKRKED